MSQIKKGIFCASSFDWLTYAKVRPLWILHWNSIILVGEKICQKSLIKHLFSVSLHSSRLYNIYLTKLRSHSLYIWISCNPSLYHPKWWERKVSFFSSYSKFNGKCKRRNLFLQDSQPETESFPLKYSK
jgi:hypothetical protein